MRLNGLMTVSFERTKYGTSNNQTILEKISNESKANFKHKYYTC